MRVLYASHTSHISGGERSLLDLLAGLPGDVAPTLACPAGRLAHMVQGLGIPVALVPETEGSLRFHPWHSGRAVFQIGWAALRLRHLARRTGAELIHANSVRAGLAADLAARMGGPPVVVHVRDCLPRSRLANLSRHLLLHSRSMLIANSLYTAAALGEHSGSSRLVTIYNPVDLERFDPDAISPAAARQRLKLDLHGPVLGVIGQLAPWKAQDDAIRCFSQLRPSWPKARLLIVGKAVFTARAARYNNPAYAESLRRLVDELQLGDAVQFLGEREDIPEILRALDLLLVPSWHEPFGRSVVEAMAMSTSVVATAVGGPREIITDQVDGLLLPPREPTAWAEAINGLLAQPLRRLEMGRRGRITARRFARGLHVTRVLSAYREALSLN